MKHWLTIGAILAVMCGIIVQGTSRAQVPTGSPPRPNPYPLDLGPGEQGATLKQPTLETRGTVSQTPSPSAAPASLPDWWNKSGVSSPLPGAPTINIKRIAQLPSNHTGINKDIEVTAQAGPWLILVMTYSGENAPQQARKFVDVLRSTYKIDNAYVFNYGGEEKRKEYERAEAARQEQLERMRKAGLKGEIRAIHVRASKIEEHTGVLIGGYRDRDEAHAALGKIRKLPPPDPKVVALDITYLDKELVAQDTKTTNTQPKISVNNVTRAYVNPFSRAFPVRNPCVKQEQTPESTAADIAFLRNINASEPFSLFNCKKPYTLAIKQFKTPVLMQDKAKEVNGFLERLAQKNVDYAAQNAHNIAEHFRKAGLPETYVLHSKYCSYVTVGGFDSPDDPNLLGMQRYLEGHFKMDAYRPLELMPLPLPMQVPH